VTTNWFDYAAGFVTVNIYLNTTISMIPCFHSFHSSESVDVCVIESCVYFLWSNHAAVDDQAM